MISEASMIGNVVMTVLDRKNIKTFANKQNPIKFKGADPDYLVYQIKEDTPYIFFATKAGMIEYINSSLDEDGKKISTIVKNIKPGEAFKSEEDSTIWIKLK